MTDIQSAVSLEIKSNTETELLGEELHFVKTYGDERTIEMIAIMGIVATIGARIMTIVVIPFNIGSGILLCKIENIIILLDDLINMHHLNLELYCLKKQDVIQQKKKKRYKN